MDTATHFVIGLSLAGLSYVDPAVAANPELAVAVLAGTVLGSQAPDFDGFTRLKSRASYVKHHRGITHSLPFIVIWTAFISAVLALLAPSSPPAHIVLWTGLAVVLHVFSDLFNAYGTQAGRPFTEQWISWNIIHIFDPVIFVSHAGAVLLWSSGIFEPAILFPVLYLFTALYYVWRIVTHRIAEGEAARLDPTPQETAELTIIPTVFYQKWHVVKACKDGAYETFVLQGKQLTFQDRAKSVQHAAVDQAKQHPDVQAFLSFTTFAVSELEHLPWGYIVRFGDVRYRHRKQYPFVAVVVMDLNLETLSSYVGWLSPKKLDARLSHLTNPAQ